MNRDGATPPPMAGGRAIFALTVLFAINLLNFADRAILGVVADVLAHRFHVSNADIGFLAGTSFVVLNSIAGLAMGSLVDSWLRNRLLAIAVALWSGMTALSGLSANFAQLAAARIGVGLGEAVGGPVSHSLLADSFAPNRRAKVFAIFFCAPFLGTALCLAISGAIVQAWPTQCGPIGLCSIASWQAPFFVFGIPGLLIAIAAWAIGDPSAGEAAMKRTAARPFRAALREITFLIPPLPPLVLWKIDPEAARRNFLFGTVIVASAAALVFITHDFAQWIAVGIAAYALASWCQALQHREPEFYARTVGSPVFVSFILGASVIAACSGAITFWSVPYAIRSLGMDHARAGGLLGPAIGLGSIAGTLLGGYSADRLRQYNPAGPIWVAVFSMLSSAMMVGLLLWVRQPGVYAITLGLFMVAITAWAPPIATLVQDLVLPSMRGRAASLYAVVLTLIGMAAGPYMVGKVADVTGSLRLAMASPFAATPICLLLLGYAIRRLSPKCAALRTTTMDVKR